MLTFSGGFFMPKYTPPLSGSLDLSLARLKEEYKNKNRDELVNKIVDVVNTKDATTEEKIGACVYALEQIESEYTYSDPRKKSGLRSYVQNGSELYELLLNKLNINNLNLMDDKHRFIYLTHYYNHVKKQKSTEATNSNSYLSMFYGYCVKTQTPLEKLEDTLKKVSARLKITIDMLMKKKPSEQAMLAAMKDHIEKYREIKKSDTKRTDLLTYHEKLLKTEGESTDISSVLSGLLISNMTEIEGEYKLLSPSRSLFYQQCQQILNINSTAELNHYAKKKDLSVVIKKISETAGNEEKIKEWSDDKFDAKKFFDTMQDKLGDQFSELKNSKYNKMLSERANALVEYLSDYAAQYGVSLALAGLVKTFIADQLSLSTIGQFLLAPEMALLAMILLMLRRPITNFCSSQLVSYVKPITDTCVKVPVTFTINSGAWAFARFRSGLEAMAEKPEDNFAFLLALNSAPESVFSKEQNKKLNYLYDMKEIEKQVANEKLEKMTRSSTNSSSSTKDEESSESKKSVTVSFS